MRISRKDAKGAKMGESLRSLRAWRLCVMLGFAASLYAQTPQEAGKRLIRQCLEAVGGQAFLKMRDRVQHGRAYQFYQEQLRGLAVVAIYTKYDIKPSSPPVGWIGVRERRDFGKNADYGSLFLEDRGYDITYRGARPYPEAYMQQYYERLRRDIFYILKYRLDEPGMIFESLGTEIIDNQPADTVRITDGDNRTVTVYLLKSSHLPVRQEYLRRDPKTRETFHEVGNYSKYRNVNGVELPMNTQLVRDEEKIFEMFSERMEINKGLEESAFAIKKGLKVLPPEK
ncbi:MAG: hypothetical protein HY238_12840 [Acidobacteria bacterium]|nr:hypothetical protein [Acidobacteriota bacterium]